MDSDAGTHQKNAVEGQVCVVITCHNRKEKTLKCLEMLYAQEPALDFAVVLVDDGSTDGTAEAVEAMFPGVELLKGTGDLFWAGGMRMALNTAMSRPYSGYLWLNDDVRLDRDALSRLLAVQTDRFGGIVGGAMRGETGKEAIYGGSLKVGVNPFKFKFVQPRDSEPLSVEVLHGNLLWVNRNAALKVGNIAPYLHHLGGDYEYCMRAGRLGVKCILAPGTFGVCPANPRPVVRRGLAGLRRMLSTKEMPIKIALPLYRRYAGPFWPLWLSLPYIRAFLLGF
jgi:GT2 family glycosyltransferase